MYGLTQRAELRERNPIQRRVTRETRHSEILLSVVLGPVWATSNRAWEKVDDTPKGIPITLNYLFCGEVIEEVLEVCRCE